MWWWRKLLSFRRSMSHSWITALTRYSGLSTSATLDTSSMWLRMPSQSMFHIERRHCEDDWHVGQIMQGITAIPFLIISTPWFIDIAPFYISSETSQIGAGNCFVWRRVRMEWRIDFRCWCVALSVLVLLQVYLLSFCAAICCPC